MTTTSKPAVTPWFKLSEHKPARSGWYEVTIQPALYDYDRSPLPRSAGLQPTRWWFNTESGRFTKVQQGGASFASDAIADGAGYISTLYWRGLPSSPEVRQLCTAYAEAATKMRQALTPQHNGLEVSVGVDRWFAAQNKRLAYIEQRLDRIERELHIGE